MSGIGDGGDGGPAAPWPAVAAWGLWGLGTLSFLAAARLAPLTIGDTLPPAPAADGLTAARARRVHDHLGAASNYASYVLLAGGGPLPGARWAALYADTGWVLWPAAIRLILLLTPTGSPPSPRWRWWVWLTAAVPLEGLLEVADWVAVLLAQAACWSRPGRWWCGSAAPAGSSACSCAGWFWPRLPAGPPPHPAGGGPPLRPAPLGAERARHEP